MADKDKYILKIKDLHETKTGRKLSDTEALDIFEDLIILVSTIYQPIPKESFQKIDKNYQINKNKNEGKLL